MQLPFKVNACNGTTVCAFGPVGDILGWDRDYRHRVREPTDKWCSAVSALQEWDNWVQLLAEITAYAEIALPLISVTRPNYACQSSYNSWWLHVQLHEATPTDFALVHKAYILQMYSPNIDSIYVGRCILSMVVVAGIVTTWPLPPIPWPNSRDGKDLWLMQIMAMNLLQTSLL